MKFIASAYITIILTIFFSCINQATIVESDHLSIILDYVRPLETLVIFDIDNTLIHPVEELSSDEWFYYMVDKKMAEGLDNTTAVLYCLPMAVYTQFNIDVEPTEQNIPELMTYLIDNNIAIMALTARSFFLAEQTAEQLHNLDINFFIPTINSPDVILPTAYPCFYKDGILFTGTNDKGEILNYFFDFMDYHPEMVIFIDDKMKNILSVEKALQNHLIPFVGIRYSGCDDRVKNFDPIKSELQWQELKERNSTR
jgi:Protein of unknown function (DUF2608)